MIDIVEKGPEYHNTWANPNCYFYPVYMVKDGKNYFMFNRSSSDRSWEVDTRESQKAHLISTGGRYFRLNGAFDDPLDMLTTVAKRKHHFWCTKGTELVEHLQKADEDPDGVDIWDFHGNRKEISSCFYYRIYDASLAELIREVADLLFREKWEEAKTLLRSVGYAEENGGGVQLEH